MKHAQLFVLLLVGLAAALFLLRSGPETSADLPTESRTEPPPTVHEAAHAHGDAGAAQRREAASPPAAPESKSTAQSEIPEPAGAETRATSRATASRPSDPIAAARANGVAICAVTGKVTDEGGTPVKGARVRALAEDRQRTTEEQPVLTDEKGAFTVGVLEPGPHDLEVDAEGYLLLVAPGPDCVLGAARDAGTLVVAKGLSIRGVVLGADGEPLQKRRIEARSGDGARRDAAVRAVSATDGTFDLAGLRPEDYRVGCLGRDDSAFSMAAITWVVARAPAENLVLRVEEHHLEVDVSDSVTKEPVPRCEVRIARRIGAREEDRGAAREGQLFVVQVDAGMEYRVVAKAPGYRTPAAQKITLLRDEPTRRIAFALLKEDPDNVVELTLTGEGGEPIERARLKVARRDGADLTFLGHVERSDPHGIHRTDPLAPGKYRIRVEARRGPAERDCHFAAELEVELGSGTVHRRVSLTKGGLFVVHVKDVEGRYLGGVGTLLKDAAGKTLPMDFCVLTKNSTSCSVDEIPAAGAAVPGDAVKPGDYSLTLSLAGFAPAVVRFTVEYDRVTPVEAVLKPAR